MTNTDWRARAACKGSPVEWFFPELGGDFDEARRLCADCPVRTDCLAETLRLRDVEGFRAGLTGDERRAMWFSERRRQGKVQRGDVDTVPVLGVIRRRQALACMGYSLADLAVHLRVTESTVSSHVGRARILRATFDRWCLLYDELKNRPGVNERAQYAATQLGWAPPSAWDESTIDDPNAQPLHTAMAVDRVARRVHLGPRGDRLRAARAAYVRGERDEWVLDGNREYERRRKQRHRDRRQLQNNEQGAAQ